MVFKIRWQIGQLDFLAGVLFLLGLMVLKENVMGGLFLMGLGILKQFSGK